MEGQVTVKRCDGEMTTYSGQRGSCLRLPVTGSRFCHTCLQFSNIRALDLRERLARNSGR